MQPGLNVVLMLTFLMSLSNTMSALICDITLTRRYSRFETVLGYLGAYILGIVVSFLIYRGNIVNGLGGIVVGPVLMWEACMMLNIGHWSSKLFVAIMATLISKVLTFFICGPVIDLIDTAPNPYNMRTLSLYIMIKALVLILLFIIYKYKCRRALCASIEILGGKLVNSLAIVFVSYLGFCVIDLIIGSLGVMPSLLTANQLDQLIDISDRARLRYVFIAFYAVITLIFIFEIFQIISTINQSSRSLKTTMGLDVAGRIQQDMLPRTFPRFPGHPGFDLYASMESAKEVGGDFYDFFLINENTLAVVIADVSDKGVPASLFMVIAKTLIRDNALNGKNPKEVFETVNDALCENNEAGMFVTAFLGYLNISSGNFTYVNAGHNLPLLRSGRGDRMSKRFEWLKAEPGFVLAGMKDTFYKLHETTLQVGDELFLYTDGVTEATNREKELFGDQRLLETVNSYLDLPIKEFTISIKQEIDKFTSGEGQTDDITMLALRL
ncbi:hypothetical protein FACS1894127_1890 [Clostridia bacterium]|nr:hypothetical protein FACS1894127_1890 [Clostridia bacterium]